MPTRSKVRCPRCRRLHAGKGLCPVCRRAAEKAADAKRGTASARGYGHRHQVLFRAGVLARDPFCVCTDIQHGHGDPCGAKATRADHWPWSRRELVLKGADPDNPLYGRGLCESCDSKQTAQRQPGGWNRR